MIESKSDVKSINRNFRYRCIKAWKLHLSFFPYMKLIFDCTLPRVLLLIFNPEKRRNFASEGWKEIYYVCVLNSILSLNFSTSTNLPSAHIFKNVSTLIITSIYAKFNSVATWRILTFQMKHQSGNLVKLCELKLFFGVTELR